MPRAVQRTPSLASILATTAALIFAWLCTSCQSPSTPPPTPTPPSTIIVGTQQPESAGGILTLALEGAERGAQRSALAGVAKPTFVHRVASRNMLVVASEVGDVKQGRDGAIVTVACASDGTPARVLGRAPSGGAGPCSLDVTEDGRWVVVANYGGGSVAVLPIDDAAAPRAPTAIVRHDGRGAVAGRQDAPHVHDARFASNGRFVVVADLGIDRVLVYRFDRDHGTLTPHSSPGIDLPPGSGPRKIAFHPSGKWIFVACELSNTVATCAWDEAAGALTLAASVSTLPEGFEDRSFAGDVLVSEDGRRLYVSNRGNDSIATFSVDAGTGGLSLLAHTASGGKFPWSLALDGARRLLFAANQGSNEVVACELDPTTGVPGAARRFAEATRPTSLALE